MWRGPAWKNCVCWSLSVWPARSWTGRSNLRRRLLWRRVVSRSSCTVSEVKGGREVSEADGMDTMDGMDEMDCRQSLRRVLGAAGAPRKRPRSLIYVNIKSERADTPRGLYSKTVSS